MLVRSLDRRAECSTRLTLQKVCQSWAKAAQTRNAVGDSLIAGDRAARSAGSELCPGQIGMR
jgi:hypothetical protein